MRAANPRFPAEGPRGRYELAEPRVASRSEACQLVRSARGRDAHVFLIVSAEPMRVR